MKKVRRKLKVLRFYFPRYRSFRNFLRFRKLVLRKGCFDAVYYLRQYTDTANANVSPIWHYYEFGWKEGRNPSPDFNTGYYLNKYPDVEAAGTNPVAHFINWGKSEGRFCNQDQENIFILRNGGIFDEEYYIKTYPEVLDSGMDPAAHFYYKGHKEGKAPCPNFNYAYYAK